MGEGRGKGERRRWKGMSRVRSTRARGKSREEEETREREIRSEVTRYTYLGNGWGRMGGHSDKMTIAKERKKFRKQGKTRNRKAKVGKANLKQIRLTKKTENNVVEISSEEKANEKNNNNKP